MTTKTDLPDVWKFFGSPQDIKRFSRRCQDESKAGLVLSESVEKVEIEHANPETGELDLRVRGVLDGGERAELLLCFEKPGLVLSEEELVLLAKVLKHSAGWWLGRRPRKRTLLSAALKTLKQN